MPPNENGNDLVKKILNRRDKTKEVKETGDSPILNEETPEPKPNVSQVHPRFPAQTANEERIDEVTDMGNLTAADLRKSSMGKLRESSACSK